MDLVTFIIPAYNAEKYIAESIESCVKQTYKNIEIIVIDDGSVDCTRDEVIKSIERYDNVRLIEQSHMGKVSAVNAGVRSASGKYIAIHAADDLCLPHRIEEEVKALMKDDRNLLVCGDCQLVDENLKIISESLYKNIGDTSIRCFKKLLNGNMVLGGTMLVSDRIVDKVFPIPESLLFEDWWIAFIACYYGNIYKLKIPLIKYRQHSLNDFGVTGSKSLRERIEKIKRDYKRHFDYYKEFRKFIYSSEIEDKKECIEIINYNVMLRKQILTPSFNERIKLKKSYGKGYLSLIKRIKIIMAVLLGDRYLYINVGLRLVVKRYFSHLVLLKKLLVYASSYRYMHINNSVYK